MKKIDSTKIHFAFDPAVAPCEHAHSGEIIAFGCQDCYCEQLKEDGWDYTRMDMTRNNPATGPSISMRPSQAMCCGSKSFPSK